MVCIRARLLGFRSLLARNAFVVAGMGRCGTTLVYEALRQYGLKGSRFVSSLPEQRVYERGRVYKTHDFPWAEVADHVKMVFLFGNPMDSVISTHRKMNEWGRRHHANLHADEFVPNDVLFERDTLRLAEHFDAWYRPQRFRFASVRYEAMFDAGVRTQLEDYLGIAVPWPDFKRRRADWTKHPRKDSLWALYGGLYQRIAQAEDLKIWEPVAQQDRTRRAAAF